MDFTGQSVNGVSVPAVLAPLLGLPDLRDGTNAVKNSYKHQRTDAIVSKGLGCSTALGRDVRISKSIKTTLKGAASAILASIFSIASAPSEAI